MKKDSDEKKKVSSEQTKKTQDKIILITRIVGVSFFLIGLLIIFVTAIIRSKGGNEEEKDVVIFESSADSIGLYLEDETLLDDEYLVLKNMDDYNNLVSHFDTWYNDAYSNYSDVVSEYDNLDEEKKQDLLDEYKTFNDGRYTKLKNLINDVNITEETFKENAIIVVEDITGGMVLQDYVLSDICLNEGKLTVYINKEVVGVVGDKTSSLYFVVLGKSYVDNEIIVNVSENNNSDPNVAYKPIIYIYPEHEMDVSVKLGYSDLLTVSYPKYNVGWNVRALEDGMLIDKDTNRELYALYYESNNKIKFNVSDEGFVVKGSDSALFLEEKLEILGLNSREINEFIVYWLPILESNKYNYIRFASEEEINNNMPLVVEPKADSVIRVLITFKGLDEKIDVKEQKLNRITRSGYSVVEWGGTIIQ